MAAKQPQGVGAGGGCAEIYRVVPQLPKSTDSA